MKSTVIPEYIYNGEMLIAQLTLSYSVHVSLMPSSKYLYKKDLIKHTVQQAINFIL